ncbi:MAG: PIG-L family deacetylase [Alphaproteobacteria bacterium]|nr:PIG-L family deacetylase [Alphaproteobacteria bacterium]
MPDLEKRMKLKRKLIQFFRRIPRTKAAKEWEIKPSDKILVITPHPDDESIGCGGLLAKYGKQCDVCLLTDGRLGCPNIEENEAIRIRKNEFDSVMKFLNVNHYECLDIPDTQVIFNLKKLKQIKTKNYDYVCIPSRFETRDHACVYPTIKRFGVGKAKIMMYEVWACLSKPTHYVNLEGLIDQKRTAIDMYESQKSTEYANRILALNTYRGIIPGKKAVECYQMTK